MAIVINSTTGEIDLDQTTPGTYVVTYTVQGVSSTQEVTVNAVDDATFSYSASSYEPTDADPTPTITGLTGGTFSAGSGLVFVDSGTNTGSSTGEIDLSASTVASYTITYDTTSSGSSVCPNTSTQTVEIAAAGIANNYSMNFDSASSDYIDVGNPSILNFERTDSFSISAWVKRKGTGVNEAIVSKMESSGDYRGYLLFIGSTNVVKFVLRNVNTGSGRLFVDSTTTITDTDWHHILITYNGSSNVSGIKIYIDGVSDTVTTFGTLSATILNNAPFNIGARNSDSLFANSKIDEVAIWDTALTSTQVSEIYNGTGTNTTKDLTTVSGSNLVYWNRMGD